MPVLRGDWRAEIAPLSVLALPMVLTQLGQISIGFVDTLMVGRLGPAELAGIALGNTIFFFQMVAGQGVLLAIAPLVAHAFGAQHYGEIGKVTRQGLWLALFISIPIVLVQTYIAPILAFLGQDPDVAALTTEYIHAIRWGAFPFLGFIALRGFFEGIGRPRVVTAFVLVAIVVNLFANYGLMFGRFGLPALGLQGTGYASSIVFWLEFLLLFALAVRSKETRAYQVWSRKSRPERAYMGKILRLGLPIGAMMGIEAGQFSVTVIMMGWIGSVSLASHQIAAQSAAITFMVPLGIGMAASVRVGQHLGGRRDALAAQAAYTGIGLASVFMSATALLFWLAPQWVVGAYLDIAAPENQAVVTLTMELLILAGLFQVVDGVQAAAAGGLRGCKDTTVPMVLVFISYWLIGLTTGYLLAFKLGMGAHGLWWGLVTGLTLASLLLTIRLHRHFSRRSAELAKNA